MESVPKWNGQERVPHPWKAFCAFPFQNDGEHIPRLLERFLFLKKANFFQMGSWSSSSHLIRQETCSSTTRRALSNGVHRFFVAQQLFEIVFLEIRTVSCGIQLNEDSAIFGISCNVSCSRAVNFESKLMLNSDESVHQFKESILRCFSGKRQRKLSDFDGILSWPVQKKNGVKIIPLVNGTVQNVFYSNDERFLTRKKAFHNSLERQRMRSYRCRTYSCRLWTHSSNDRTRSSWSR